MSKFNDNVKEIFSNAGIYTVATASKDGLPNVVPMTNVKVYDEEDSILIANNLMNKTLKNLEENPWIAVSVWDLNKGEAYQIKGMASIVTSGKPYEDAVALVQASYPDLKPKSAILLKITNIYNCFPGPDLGKELK